MDTLKLKHIVESLGGNVMRQETGLYIMLPINFPWYGKHTPRKCNNSRIIAYATTAFGSLQWMDVWANVDIRKNPLNGKPLGIMLRSGGLSVAALRDFDEDALTAWLEKKIGEVSNKAKEYTKMLLTLERETGKNV